ncbi:hypothetical protein FHN55_02385 [Streptomyces sp. NP160]|uniref:hypothetical protein n=1 Tax=Streptomyces sp. NP160 TaxID=2586637 RepID=UPI00111B8249|nr:hypothetical protein [Streptomyces sp. NP160]TNM69627.1 hypothetical protein FHN55_02385 [Streptomyces sp. NP160]
MPRERGPSPGAGDVVDLDEPRSAPLPRGGPHDRADEDEDDDGRPHRRVRPRWLASRWTLPVAVAVVALLLELSAGRQLRASAQDELARAVQLSAVQLGGASVTSAYAGDPSTYDAQGRLLTVVQVQVLNGGDRPVHITVRGTSEPLLTLAGPPAAAAVGPAGSNVLALPVAVDCSKAPPVPRAYTGAEDAEGEQEARVFSLDLDVAVTATGEGPVERRRYLVADSGWGWGDIAQQLAYACDPVSSGALSVSMTPRDDGRMDLQVRNDADTGTTVALESTPWLRATSDVELPARVPAGSRLSAVVSLDPDCARAGHPSEGGLELHVDPVLLDDDGTSQPAQYPGAAPTAAWAARQVALACG